MNIVGILLLIIHVACCIGLILVVLLQAGKGASLGAAFGGGSSQTMFGTSSVTMIGKLTWVMAGAFMATSLLLTLIPVSSNNGMQPAPAVLQEEPVSSPPAGMPSAPAASEEGAGTAQDVSGVTGGELTPEAAPAPAPVEAPAAPAPAESATHPAPESHPSE